MKWMLVLLAALLPFLHGQTYEVQVKGCDASGITMSYENTTFTAELFNVGYVEEDGWKDTCALLQEAKTVSFEVDDAVAIEEPLAVYLYADGEMVQVSLLEAKKAYIEIRNPNYLHEETLEMAQGVNSVMAQHAGEGISKGALPFRSYAAYALVLGVWLFLFYHLVYRHRPLHVSLLKKKGVHRQGSVRKH